MNQEQIYTVLISQHISEKSAMNAQNHNQYVFKVRKDANKNLIKQAVESLFDVKVDQVRTSVCKGKTKRFGRHFGKRKDWKKAYVSLAEGSSIETMTAE